MIKESLMKSYQEITNHLENEIIPFWEQNGIDKTYGGYLTCFDGEGKPANNDMDKYIVTQTRMIWGFSALARIYGRQEYIDAAKQGVYFFLKYFWDEKFGGWYWKTKQDGTLLDGGKVVYGQTFAIYALSEYTLATKDPVGLVYAGKTFDLLQKYCTDTANGGYYENLERDWQLSEPGFAAGDLKSLDIHMHTMEAFTSLYECSGEEIHKRKLEEVIHVILTRMVDQKIGCGYNQFDISFHRKPAINIRRTWNAERETGETISNPMDSTSYGHNVELGWLLNRAAEILKKPKDYYNAITKKLVDHALTYGYDHERGGIYRDGPHNGEAIVKDKEWWQNCEVLVGFLDSFEHFKEEKYVDAFIQTWEFDNKYMINHKVGEWMQLLKNDGEVIISQIGNPWKAFYHSGRAMMECKKRLEQLLERK